ncbi:MAG: hypothetical protein ABMB14_24545 [Myxococcota bacterium]
MWWTVALGCAGGVTIEAVDVWTDADGATATAVDVVNRGPTPIWVWSSPTRLAPPDDGRSVLAYDVEPYDPGDGIVEFQWCPETELVPPGARRTLTASFSGSVPIRSPEVWSCADLEDGSPCADTLEVDVAYAHRRLDRGDPVDWAGCDANEAAVAVGAWSRIPVFAPM